MHLDLRNSLALEHRSIDSAAAAAAEPPTGNADWTGRILDRIWNHSHCFHAAMEELVRRIFEILRHIFKILSNS